MSCQSAPAGTAAIHLNRLLYLLEMLEKFPKHFPKPQLQGNIVLC
ncbi:unnamed protein product, partial [Staurois parvus]